MWCTACGLSAVPKAGPRLADYYLKDYAATNRKDREIDPDTYFSDAHRQRSKAMQRYFSRAQSQIQHLNDHDAAWTRVLDYGSGPGYFLFLSPAKERYAFEPDLSSRKYLDH